MFSPHLCRLITVWWSSNAVKIGIGLFFVIYDKSFNVKINSYFDFEKYFEYLEST